MAAKAACWFSSCKTYLSCFKISHRNCLLLPAASFLPLPASKPNANLTLPRLRIGDATTVVVAPKRACRVFAVSASDSGAYPEADSNDSNVDATIDIKLPRRSLQVQFTCDECGERTTRLINRLSYEKGLVLVQCAGCLQYHKLADNLGLIVEYDLRDEM